MSVYNDDDKDIPLIKIDNIKSIEEFSHLSDEELKELVYMLHLFGVLTYEVFNNI
jgi:hypothetical protein